VFVDAAQRSKNSHLRRYAIQQLEKAETGRQASVKTTFLNMYLVEKNTLVKARLLEALNKISTSAEMTGIKYRCT